jgi:hypothetical protein
MDRKLESILAEFQGKTLYRVEISIINGPSVRMQDRNGGIVCEGNDDSITFKTTPLQPQEMIYTDPLLIFKHNGTTLFVPIQKDTDFHPNTFGGGGGSGIPDCLMASLVTRNNNTLVFIEYI